MKNELDKAFSWLLASSADPTAVSLTVKGVLVGVVPFLMAALGFAHVDFGVDQANQIVNAIVTITQSLLTVVAAAMTVVGLVRKVYLSAYPPVKPA